MDESRISEGLERLATCSALEATLAPLCAASATVHAQIVALESCWYMRNQLLRDTDWSSMAHGLEVRVPFVDVALIIHGIEAWEAPKKFLVKWFSTRIDSIIAVSRFSMKRFASWSKVPAERFFILRNCGDLEAFRPQPQDPALLERYGIELNDKVLLTVGRMASQERYKGFDQMIELMPRLLRQFPNVKYLIVGDGDDRERLEEKAMSYCVVDRVLFTGRVPETEKVEHYNLADAFVMPSSGEGFGIVFIEAAACGVPVIGSLADGSREALLDGAIGQLVDLANPEDLMKKVGAVLQSPSGRHLGTAIETFSLANFRGRVTQWCDIQVAAKFAH